MFPDLHFIDAASAEAWDAEFRLRQGSIVLDRTIADTWRRVVDAAPLDWAGTPEAAWLAAGLASWRMLPDDRLLRQRAANAKDGLHDPRGWLNVAAYVREPFSDDARFDFGGLCRDAGVLADLLGTLRLSGSVQLGIVGFADALVMQGMSYGSAASVDFAKSIARCVARSGVPLATRLPGEALIATFANNVAPGFSPLARPRLTRSDPFNDAAAARWLRRFGRTTHQATYTEFSRPPDHAAWADLECAAMLSMAEAARA